VKLWVPPESKQPAAARRGVEQQRHQCAVVGAQQQHTGQRQQQHWLSLCEGDSRGSRSAGFPGPSARVHGPSRCPSRKPTGGSLFSHGIRVRTNTHAARGPVAGPSRPGNAPAPFQSRNRNVPQAGARTSRPPGESKPGQKTSRSRRNGHVLRRMAGRMPALQSGEARMTRRKTGVRTSRPPARLPGRQEIPACVS
jgi:hypothetical protein